MLSVQNIYCGMFLGSAPMEGGEGSQWAEEDTEQRRSLSGRAEARMPVRLLCYWTWMTLGKAGHVVCKQHS